MFRNVDEVKRGLFIDRKEFQGVKEALYYSHDTYGSLNTPEYFERGQWGSLSAQKKELGYSDTTMKEM